MFNASHPHFPYLDNIGAVGRDTSGNFILVGLISAETERYLQLVDIPHHSPEEEREYADLHDKHERARLNRLMWNKEKERPHAR